MNDIHELREYARRHQKMTIRRAAQEMADTIVDMAQSFAAHVTADDLANLTGYWARASRFMDENPLPTSPTAKIPVHLKGAPRAP